MIESLFYGHDLMQRFLWERCCQILAYNASPISQQIIHDEILDIRDAVENPEWQFRQGIE